MEDGLFPSRFAVVTDICNAVYLADFFECRFDNYVDSNIDHYLVRRIWTGLKRAPMQTDTSPTTSMLEPPSQSSTLSRTCNHKPHFWMKGSHSLGIQDDELGAKSIESTSANSSMGDYRAPQPGRIYALHLLTCHRASHQPHERALRFALHLALLHSRKITSLLHDMPFITTL
jgi:hypothetical protein